MPELKRLHRSVMDPNNDTDQEDGISLQPLDIDEQEELIRLLETGNSKRNSLYVSILTAIYSICEISLIWKTRNSMGKEFWFYGLGCISIALSIIGIRYEMVTDFQVFMTSQVQINNMAVQRYNVVILILVEWLALTELTLGIVSQIPFFLFLVSILMKKWVRSMEGEISSLHGMKYKYKSA